MTITYSRGSNTYDATPEQRSAPDFAAFCDAILSDRANVKGQQYVCAAMADGHRCKDSAQSRRWIGLDLDGATPAEFDGLLRALSEYSALVYSTASSTPEQPRARVVVELAMPTDRDGARAASRKLRESLGAGLAWDASCDRAEQPLFLPLHGAQSWRFTGRPLIPAAVVAAPVVVIPAAGVNSSDPLSRLAAMLDMQGIVSELQCAPEGGRNELLSTVAYRIGGYVTAGRLDRTDAMAQLVAATAAWGEDAKSVATIQRQIDEGGRKEPRHVIGPAVVNKDAIPKRRAFNDGPRIRNAADLMRQQFAPTTWIIDGILPAGVTILSGDPKVGKSFLSLQFAFAVATGCPLWDGRNPEKRGRSLYLALEDNDKRMQRRITGVKVDRGAQDADMRCFDYATDWSRGEAGVEEIRAYLTANRDCRLPHNSSGVRPTLPEPLNRLFQSLLIFAICVSENVLSGGPVSTPDGNAPLRNTDDPCSRCASANPN